MTAQFQPMLNFGQKSKNITLTSEFLFTEHYLMHEILNTF